MFAVYEKESGGLAAEAPRQLLFGLRRLFFVNAQVLPAATAPCFERLLSYGDVRVPLHIEL